MYLVCACVSVRKSESVYSCIFLYISVVIFSNNSQELSEWRTWFTTGYRPLPFVVSYSIKIHSFFCLCYVSTVHSPFQSEFYTAVDLLLRISISIILFLPCGHPVMPTSSSSSSSLCLSFSKVFHKALPTQDVINVFSFYFFDCP